MTGNSPPWMGKWAHDLRGPLSPIQSALFLLRHGGVEGAERDELFDLIDRQMRRLTGMIDEIGDWVRADQGRLLTRRGSIDLVQMIEASRGLGATAVEVEYAGEADGACVLGDASRMANLLSTFFWLIAVPAEEADATGRRNVATVEADAADVRMSGPLNPAMLAGSTADALFAEPQPAPLGDGLGLRLLIASAIAQGHGGELGTRPRAGGGTDVVLRLPRAPG
ncbi:MAG TPA: histidine kinase dimerization/phospho-acceptor domain-containing protein [Lysobacter sp.]